MRSRCVNPRDREAVHSRARDPLPLCPNPQPLPLPPPRSTVRATSSSSVFPPPPPLTGRGPLSPHPCVRARLAALPLGRHDHPQPQHLQVPARHQPRTVRLPAPHHAPHGRGDHVHGSGGKRPGQDRLARRLEGTRALQSGRGPGGALRARCHDFTCLRTSEPHFFPFIFFQSELFTVTIAYPSFYLYLRLRAWRSGSARREASPPGA
jgi:hypothetical protein